MGAKAFLTKDWPTRLGFYLGKYLPPRGGHFIAALVTRLIVITKPDLYWAARANLRHVLGEKTPDDELDHTLHRLIGNVSRGYYELFHNIGLGKVRAEEFYPPVHLTAESKRHLDQALAAGKGVFVLGVHMSNFDLAWIGVSQYLPMPMQALSLADPPPGFEFFNRLREKGNVIVTPISPSALREAIARLRGGGVVVTGIDHPLKEGNEPVEFFGATAYLPTGYIRIPLRTDCLIVTCAAYHEDGKYNVIVNPPMAIERTGNEATDVAVNLRRVLNEAEDLIRRRPDQWMMFVPVWPEVPPRAS